MMATGEVLILLLVVSLVGVIGNLALVLMHRASTDKLVASIQAISSDKSKTDLLEKSFFQQSQVVQQTIRLARDMVVAVSKFTDVMPEVDQVVDAGADLLTKITDGKPNDSPPALSSDITFKPVDVGMAEITGTKT